MVWQQQWQLLLLWRFEKHVVKFVPRWTMKMIPSMHLQESLNVTLVDYRWTEVVLSFDWRNRWLNWMIVNLLTLVLMFSSPHLSVVVLMQISFPHLSVAVLMQISSLLSCPYAKKKRTSSPTHPLSYQVFVPVKKKFGGDEKDRERMDEKYLAVSGIFTMIE